MHKDKSVPKADVKELTEIYNNLEQHRDAVKDVSFKVDNIRAVYENAIANSAVSVSEPTVVRDKVDGDVLVDNAHFDRANELQRGVLS